jgi:ABC-type polysaccharide/polyol phosphate export permease
MPPYLIPSPVVRQQLRSHRSIVFALSAMGFYVANTAATGESSNSTTKASAVLKKVEMEHLTIIESSLVKHITHPPNVD